MLSGNMFELVAYCVAYCCVLCFISMLCHLAFSSNILDNWYPALVNVIDLFCDLGDCDLGDLGDLGTVDLYMALRANLGFIWVIADLWPVVRTWVYFLFRHTSDLNVWSWYIVNNKLMIWKLVLGLHSDRTTHIF